MNLLNIFEFILHLDKYLYLLINTYGLLVYGILFFIIFMETGFVITPFLPGDSILFAVGALSALGLFNIITIFLLVAFAAILGDTVNYWIGHYIGPRVFEKESKFIKKEYLERTRLFYKRHGGKTIILARFIPIIRTFAPFVAGVGTMDYGKFIVFNIIGGILWVFTFLFMGYFFGNIPFVKNNFELVIIFIILISTIPIFLEIIKNRRKTV